MNRLQLIVLWVIGIAVSAIFNSTGQKLLIHAASNKETWETGYPITLMGGTVWAYVIPTIIMGIILIYTVKGSSKKGRRK
jgi:ABC-type Fe3+-siderophore transport system permease subunit